MPGYRSLLLKVACDAVPAVEVTGLTVRYGPAGTPVAVDDLDLTASAGEVLVVLGPNGAGKTSTVETLEGYRRPVAGRVRVLGLNPQDDHAALSGRVGVMLQRGGVYPMLGPRRVLQLFAGYYPAPVPAEELLDLVGLRRVATTPWRNLSGGEQQRLSLALALVGRPEVAFLDEPTAGVDPEGRIAVRSVVAGMREKGVCVVLTTHELGEAEKMADRIVILSAGKVVLEGTPHGLTAGAGSGVGRRRRPGRHLRCSPVPRRRGPGGRHRPRDHRRRDGGGPLPGGGHAGGDPRRHRRRGELPGRTRRHTHRPGGGQDPGGRLFRDRGGGGAGAGRGDGGGGPLGPASGPGPGPGPIPVSTTADALRPLTAQTGAEVHMTLRRGETLLLTLGIPVVFLVFFSKVSVVSTPTATPANFFVPGILSLAVMSTAMVSLGIATGFERGYGVLKRLGATPLGRPRLLGAKIITIVAVELLQAAVLLPIGLALGWNPGGGGAVAVGGAVGAILLGSTAFAGIGLLMAGTLRAEVNLAAANGLYLILLLLGGMIVPLSKLPSGLASFAKLLPAAALSSALHATLGSGGSVPAESWVVLAVWAVAAPVAAALTFKWE